MAYQWVVPPQKKKWIGFPQILVFHWVELKMEEKFTLLLHNNDNINNKNKNKDENNTFKFKSENYNYSKSQLYYYMELFRQKRSHVEDASFSSSPKSFSHWPKNTIRHKPCAMFCFKCDQKAVNSVHDFCAILYCHDENNPF